MRMAFTLAVLALSLCLSTGIVLAYAQQTVPAHEQPSSTGTDTAPASIRFERLTADDGLSSQVVFTAMQDQRGFMWFATWSGLNRYDGYSFTQYKHTPSDSTSIATNNIWSLYEDRSGVLWVGSTTGVLSRFDPVTERFTHFKHVPDDSMSLMLDGIQAMHEDRSGMLWVGRFDGLDRMNPETGAFTRYRHIPGDASSLSHNSVSDIHEDESGALWVSTANGLNRIDPETGKCTRFLYEPYASGGPAQHPSFDQGDIYEDRREPGLLWIGSSQGLLRFNTASGEHERFLPDPQGTGANRITGIAPDPDHPEVLWLATEGGLYRFDQRTGQFNGYHHDPGDPTSLSNDVLTQVYTDRTGIIWVCTGEHGVNTFDPAAAGVEHYRQVPGDSNSLPSNTVATLHEDSAGSVWVGLWAEEGLARIDRKTGQVTHWKLPLVKAILEDRSGTLWAGTYGGGLHRLDPTTGTFIQNRYDPVNTGTFGTNMTFRLHEDRAGVLWIGSLNGLKRVDPQTGAFTRFDHDPEDPTSLSDKFVVSLYEDRSGTLWVGTTRGGLNRMDRATGTFTRFQHDPRNPHSLSSNAVWSLLEREREPGVLWIGTDGGGLNRFDTRTGIFTHFTREDGLVDNTVWGILEDEQGRLWMSTPGGLSRFDPERQAVRNYTDGRLQSREFKDQAYFKGRSGELFFGGVNGFNAFFPADMRDNPHPPQVTLTGLKLFNQPVPVGEKSPLRQPIWRTEEVRLAHDQNSISFDFVALHYRNPQQNQYAYRLEGFDKDWVQGTGPRTATYTNLDPGEYVFRVKASNSDGVRNEEGASVRVVVLPPWWRTWWAYVLYGLLFAAGVFAVNRIQRRRLIRKERERAQARELEQARQIERAYNELKRTQQQLIHQEKLASLGALTAGIAHEIKNPLNFVNNFSSLSQELLTELRQELQHNPELRLADVAELLEDLQGNAARVEEHGKRADAIVRSMLEHSRSMKGERQLVAVNALVEEYVNLGFHGFRAQHPGFEVELRRDYDEAAGSLELVAPEIGRVLLNLLSNAFYAVHEKHLSLNGQYAPVVRVSTRRRQGQVEIRVEDNGPGIASTIEGKIFEPFFTTKPPGQGTGLGLSLSHEIVVQGHGGVLTVEGEEGKGAVFVMLLPQEAQATGA